MVERRIHVPAIEARYTCCFISSQDEVLVEGAMGRVVKHCGLNALELIVDGAVADELHLGNTRNGLEVWM